MEEINEQFFEKKNTKIKKTLSEIINSDEKILWKGIPKKSSYALSKSILFTPIAFFWALIDIIIIITLFNSNPPTEVFFIIIPFFAIHLTPVWIFIAIIVKAGKELKNTIYVITNKRLLTINKLEYNISAAINIKDLVKVSIHRDIVDKMLRVGDILVIGEFGQFTMYDQPNWKFIFEKLREICLTQSKKTDKKPANFYKYFNECEHCGSYFEKETKSCPNCGASAKFKA